VKAYDSNPHYNVAFETWLSSDTDPELSALSTPAPNNVRHHIRVLPVAGYHQHYDVFGLIAAGYPQIAYDDPNSPNTISDRWSRPVRYVTVSGEGDCPMKVDPGRTIARILAVDVTLISRWTAPVSILLRPLELQIPVI
jgi:hypothetical protein